MTDSAVDTDRTVVRTYVPAYQREAWDEHADELGMSRSEFVKTMVQAGRTVFDDDSDLEKSTESLGRPADSDSPDQEHTDSEQPPHSGLEERVLNALSESGHLSWDELLAELTDDMEKRLESTLQTLQAENRIRYSGRNGGYVLDE